MKFLKISSKTTLDHKDQDNFLFNLSEFGPSQEWYRSQENFVCSHGIALDFDNGRLTKDDFIRIFWTDAGPTQRISFVIMNSFSRSPEQPNRFRTIMFYDQPASLEQHQAVFDALVRRLSDHGFTPNDTMLDPNCRSGNQSFWLPCTNRRYPEWAMYEKFGLDRERDFKLICARDYEITAPDSIEKLRCATQSSILAPEADSERKARVLADLHARYGTKREGRHHVIMGAANSLAHAGFSEAEIESHLLDILGNDPRLRQKARDCIRKLEREGHVRG